ncbi:protein spire homolog 1-like, partial [Anneissia japonica]|uniref:protein spire homolog 1-like n=1 Tax=Anneissia japonica TaxID=1529436 RepID=UPI00142563B8
VCTNRVSSKASGHYQAVCHAVVAEVEELTTFLEVLSKGTKNIRTFSIDTDTEGEKELEDIKPREWINGDIPPRVRKEAHDVILDFIRSRPPLRPAKDRVLNSTPPKMRSLHDQLLTGIRSKPQLTPVSERVLGPKIKVPGTKISVISEKSDSEFKVKPIKKENSLISTPSEMKKILAADFDLNWSDEDTEVEMTDNEFKSSVISNGIAKTKQLPTPPTPEPEKGFFQRTEERFSLKLPKKLGFIDLSFLTGEKEDKSPVETTHKSKSEATEEFSDYDSDREERLQRRHSISLCQSSRLSSSLVPSMVNTSPNSEWVLVSKMKTPSKRVRKKRRSHVKFDDNSDSLKVANKDYEVQE